MSLLFNMLSRFVIAFLLRSKCLLISWLQSQSAVILEPKKIKSVTVSIFFPSICHECGWCASLGKVAPVILGGECTVNHRLQLPMTMTSSVFPSICHGQMPWSSFLNVEFEASFFTLLFNLFLFNFFLLSAIRVVPSAYLRLLLFYWQSWFQLVLHLPSSSHQSVATPYCEPWGKSWCENTGYCPR